MYARRDLRCQILLTQATVAALVMPKTHTSSAYLDVESTSPRTFTRGDPGERGSPIRFPRVVRISKWFSVALSLNWPGKILFQTLLVPQGRFVITACIASGAWPLNANKETNRSLTETFCGFSRVPTSAFQNFAD